MYVCRFAHGGDTFPLGTTSLLEGISGLQEASTKACPNSAKIVPQHVGAMSWQHAKFHDFQACFGFTAVKKPSFSIFPAEPRCTDVWIAFTFLAWYLEIHPRTHMWVFNQVWCTGACAWVQIWIMHIKWKDTQLMYKNSQTNLELFQNVAQEFYLV